VRVAKTYSIISPKFENPLESVPFGFWRYFVIMIAISLIKAIHATIDATSVIQTFKKCVFSVVVMVNYCRLFFSEIFGEYFTLREKIEKMAFLEVLGTGYGVKMPKPSLKTLTVKSSLRSKTSPGNPLHAISTFCFHFSIIHYFLQSNKFKDNNISQRTSRRTRFLISVQISVKFSSTTDVSKTFIERLKYIF